MLYIVNEQTFSGYNVISLDLIYIIAILLSTLVIISKNPIISVLFLFILMLINVRISELLIDSINSIPLAILLGSFFNYFVNNVLPYMMVAFNSLLYHFNTITKLANVTSVSWDGYLSETSHITSIGNILYGNYSIWLIITSIILLLAMVGAIVITLKPQTNNK